MTCKLADPFSHVHPLFWPVLWLSLRAFAAWSRRMIAAGHGFAGLSVELTWYGWIHVTYLDLSPQRAAFHRHMAGEAGESWQARLAAHRARVGQLAALGAHSTPALARVLQDTAATAPLAPPSPLRGSRARDERRDLRHKHRTRRARPPPMGEHQSSSPQSALFLHRTAIAAAATGAGSNMSTRLTRSASAMIFNPMDWSDIITFQDGKRSGKPCIRGLRITVFDILEYLAAGMTPDEIVADFPELGLNDIRAALAYAADRERRLAGHAA